MVTQTQPVRIIRQTTQMNRRCPKGRRKPLLLMSVAVLKSITTRPWTKCFIIIIITKAPREVRGEWVTRTEVAR